jgi:hypothetical protein
MAATETERLSKRKTPRQSSAALQLTTAAITVNTTLMEIGKPLA